MRSNETGNSNREAGKISSNGGFTNGMGGRTNGMTNGLGGKTNGLTNGMGGRTNGMTNGLQVGGSGRMPGDRGGMSSFKISLVLIIAFIVMVPATFFLVAYDDPAYSGIRVDGDFSDWNDAMIFGDSNTYPTAALDIIEYSVETNAAGNIFLYARARDTWFSSAEVDSLMVFIDADDNPATGYRVGSMGAEYAVEIHGWDNAIRGRQFGVFAGNDQHNWSAWSWRSVTAALGGDRMEIGIPGSSISMSQGHGVLFMTRRGGETAKVCDAAVSLGTAALVIDQRPLDVAGIISQDHIMNLKLTAQGGDVDVMDVGFFSNIGTPAVSGLPVQIPAGQTVTVQVSVSVSERNNGSFVDVRATSATTLARTTVIGQGLTAYARAAPGMIIIDGAFGDWNAVPRAQDPAGDSANPDIDITSHAATNSTTHAFFYLGVHGDGTLLGGATVPTLRSRPGVPGEPGEPSPPAPIVRNSGEDVTRIYIDTIPGAGMSRGGIDADYMIEIKGRNGQITSRGIYALPGMTFMANIEAANRGREMEIGLDLGSIIYTGTLQYIMESTDWKGEGDATTSAGLVTPVFGTRAGGGFGGGNGTADNPYLIEDALDLQAMQNNLSAHYALANDIDASITATWNGGMGFNPLGNLSEAFTGALHGDRHSIFGLYVDRPSENNVGLFGFVNGGLVSRVSLDYADIIGSLYVGGLIGYSMGGTVAESNVIGSVAGQRYVGGLVGYNDGTVTESFTNGDVTGSVNYIGGLVGLQTATALTERSYSKGEVYGESSVGGLVGENDGEIRDSYSMADAMAVMNAGGLAGRNWGAIHDSYSIGYVNGSDFIGGLLGHNAGVVESSFWDYEASGVMSSYGGTPKNTDQMLTRTTFNGAGWDFFDIWWNVEDMTYPLHKWQPVFNMNTFSSYRTIGLAIELADLNDQLIMDQQVFHEDVTLSKAIRFRDSSFTLLGDIKVTGTGSLNLYRVSLHCGQVSVEQSGNLLLQDSPATVISHSVWIDGIVHIDSSTWMINNTFNGQHGIQVNSTGEMYIEDTAGTGRSTITAYNTEHKYWFRVLPGAVLLVEYSNIMECGWDSSNPGLEVYTDDAFFHGSWFFWNYNGLNLFSSQGHTLWECLVAENSNIGILLSGVESAHIRNSTITTNPTGISLENGSTGNRIYGNDIMNSTICGLNMNDCSGNWVYRNQFLGNAMHAWSTGSNTWNLSEAEGGGNLWEGWTSPDADQDGFVDDPYEISGGVEMDLLPIAVPEFHHVLLPVLAILGLVFLTGKKEDEPEEEYTEDVSEQEEAADDHEEEPTGQPKTGKTMLFMGLGLGILGLGGIAGLRSGIIQSMMGYTASPGIGSQEMAAIGAALGIIALGLVLILMWGIRNDPFFRKPGREDEEESVDLEEPEEDVPADEEGPQAEDGPSREDELRTQRCEKMLSAVLVLPEDREKLEELIVEGMPISDFVNEIKGAVHRRKDREEAEAAAHESDEAETVEELEELEL